MKTKVAEALMFGKRVIGTQEAFSGYEEIADLVGSICATPDEFARAIDREIKNPAPRFDERLRSIYAERYSLPAVCSRLRNILT
jgi:glycosyltransferase involved in cell wall biosynthesis